MSGQTHAAGAGGPRAVEPGAGSGEAPAGRVGPRSAFSWDDVMLGVAEYALYIMGTVIGVAGEPAHGAFSVAVAIYLRLQRKL